MKRIIIGGTKSGCGKTTVTCALLAALKRRNINVSAFKCGPDYIDPMFHRKVIGVESYNLDSFFFDRNTILNLLGEYGKKSDISVIEGVMGFYDGSCGSAYSVSELTETPVVMVIDCKGMSDSIGAVMSGFLNYRKNRISGFIFDRLPEKLIPLAQKLCCELGTEYFGCLPKCGASIESRHLGLVTADEIADIQTKLERLGELAEKYILIDKLINSCDVPLPEYNPLDIPQFDEHPTIAAARDSAFCFIYCIITKKRLAYCLQPTLLAYNHQHVIFHAVRQFDGAHLQTLQPASHFVCPHRQEYFAKLFGLLLRIVIAAATTKAVQFLVLVIDDVGTGQKACLLAHFVLSAAGNIFVHASCSVRVNPALRRSSQKVG